MNGTLLDPYMCLLGPKRPLGGPKTNKYWFLDQKSSAQVPFVTAEDQIGVNISVLTTQK